MKNKRERTRLIHEMFYEIWDEREDEYGLCYCFETGEPMEPWKYRSNTECYDHVLEKNDRAFPQYALLKKNIIIVLPETHRKKHSNIDLVPKIKEYKEKLLYLHYENKLEE